VDYEAADALLKRARWNVKLAVVMERAGLTLLQAQRRLRKANDSVAEAIGEDAETRLKELLQASKATPAAPRDASVSPRRTRPA
jgi:hypothetical protein